MAEEFSRDAVLADIAALTTPPRRPQDLTIAGMLERHSADQAAGRAALQADAPEGFVALQLVPVEIFGENDCCEHGLDVSCPSAGYGLCDAVEVGSDCNRARGHIYRLDEPSASHPRAPGDTVTIYVRAEDEAWFERKFGDG